MNLISDSWIPVITQDGQKIKIKPAQLSDPNIMELDFPRLDFQGAGYQLLIGLLQTTFAPTDIEDWIDFYESPPSSDALQLAFDPVIHAFSVTGEGVARGARFMQDLDNLETVKSINPITGLLIEAPGVETLKKNIDFFIKRNTVNRLSLPMAALALFTLQINGPSGGRGHLTGLRGGGPMTTLVRPSETNSSLWHKLWWNVISRSEWDYPDPNVTDGSVFPWLAPTRIGDKTGEPIYSKDPTIHPLHVYWAMPRRIRLIVEPASNYSIESLIDDLTGEAIEPTQQLVNSYRRQTYGANYEGDWSPHPITPYRYNPKKPEEIPFSIKAQPGGITYKIWHMLTFSASQDKTGFTRAMVLDHANKVYDDSEGEFYANGLWAFSYDMDNMKARGFYSQELPFYYIDEKSQTELLQTVLELHTLTEIIVKQLRDSIKKSWMSERHAKDTKGDMSMIDAMFWQRSERLFFNAIENAIQNGGSLTDEAAMNWFNNLRQLTLKLYDEQVLSTDVVSQRHMAQLDNLRAFLFGNKKLTQFYNKHKVATDA